MWRTCGPLPPEMWFSCITMVIGLLWASLVAGDMVRIVMEYEQRSARQRRRKREVAKLCRCKQSPLVNCRKRLTITRVGICGHACCSAIDLNPAVRRELTEWAHAPPDAHLMAILHRLPPHLGIKVACAQIMYGIGIWGNAHAGVCCKPHSLWALGARLTTGLAWREQAASLRYSSWSWRCAGLLRCLAH